MKTKRGNVLIIIVVAVVILSAIGLILFNLLTKSKTEGTNPFPALNLFKGRSSSNASPSPVGKYQIQDKTPTGNKTEAGGDDFDVEADLKTFDNLSSSDETSEPDFDLSI